MGSVALLIASKFHDVYQPSLTHIQQMSRNIYSLEEIQMMERKILVLLNFDVNLPTSLELFELYSLVQKLSPKQISFG